MKFLNLDQNDKFVLQLMLPSLVEEHIQEFEHDNYSGHHIHAANMLEIYENMDSPNSRILKPVIATGRAVGAGAALAATDGPLPIMDVIGFGVSVTLTAKAWYEYYHS